MNAMTHTSIRQVLLALALPVVLTAGLVAQGIELKSKALVLFGSAVSCTQPATIDFDKVKKATPEWKKIRSEGVRKGSARYSLLMSDLEKRLKRLASGVAGDAGKDCIVRKGDIKNDNGLSIADLTSKLIDAVGDDASPALASFRHG